MNSIEIEKKEFTLEIEIFDLERKLRQKRRKLKELKNIKPLVIRHEEKEENDRQEMIKEIERLTSNNEIKKQVKKRNWGVAPPSSPILRTTTPPPPTSV
jgi:hypothetical protein